MEFKKIIYIFANVKQIRIMASKKVDIEKIEEFLIDNLKEIPTGFGRYKIKADCSLSEFIDKLEKAMED